MKYMNIEIDDNVVNQYKNKYGITAEEACKMYLDDNNIIEDKELTKNNKKELKESDMKISYNIEEKKERKKRVANISNEKQELFQSIVDGLTQNNYEFNILNNNKLIQILINGHSFNINLIENRKKKESK